MATQAEIQQLVDQLVAGYQPEKVILFGSHAYGTPHEDSDVDLFVIKDDPRPRFERELDARLALDSGLVPLDLIIYSPKELARADRPWNGLVRDILDKGRIVYERG